MEQDDLFKKLDDFIKETDELYGTPIRSSHGDVQNLKVVQLGEYWNDADQIVRPVGDEKVWEYLNNKDDKPFVFPKLVTYALVTLLLIFGIVHGISIGIR